MDSHRRTGPGNVEVHRLDPPFSSFDFVEERYAGRESIRRLFSLGRSSKAETLVVEEVPPHGIIAEENEDILSRHPGYTGNNVHVLSFWARRFSDGKEIAKQSPRGLLGYAILKHDVIKEEGIDSWHVFEAVFRKYAHRHNCVPRPKAYRVSVAGKLFTVRGVLYCQQNGLNKACAQVALRSLLSRVDKDGDLPYRRINTLAAEASGPFDPAKGLSVKQIRHVLTKLGLRFADVDYERTPSARVELPYQKYAYAGLESGIGALVGFRLAGRDMRGEARHIIPFYGHTFNKDTWAPEADVAYFRIGEGVGYVPSESWTSSFLGHDDNFGPNFCIPRLYIERDKVDYVVEIFRPGFHGSGLQAEAFALGVLYSLLPSLKNRKGNKWVQRLLYWTGKQRIVFRAQAMSRGEYVRHLRRVRDWEDHPENPGIPTFLAKEIPRRLWVVEISTPQLFPANERKLGEIVLDASREAEIPENSPICSTFEFVRLPSAYYFGGQIIAGIPQFLPIPSELQSHTPLIRL